ncbi:MAG: CHAT domain-containing protein, partial [Bacteroidetes bacterium]|nr:CHAT domain-containing protein [Bacteroidota bacterium]
MDVLFFAFANDQLNPLPSLQKEANELFRLLSPGELQQRYILYFDRFATRENIAYYLTQYKNNLALFHYSGHAGRDALQTEEGISHSAGIAQLLGQCPKLKMVFLNGCSTEGQVKGLQANGIPSVMATSSPVNDRKATDFSIRFYQALSVQDKLETAFELAKGDVLTKDPNLDLSLHRDLVFDFSVAEVEKSDKPQWGLFVKENREDILTWQLPHTISPPPKTDFTPNGLLINTLIESLAPYAREVRNIKRDEEDGEEIDFADKRLAILNSLPAPIAEQLRKLMVPLAESDKGFDKISEARAEQLVKTSQTILELYTFTMISQLWDLIQGNPQIKFSLHQRETLQRFFKMNREERENFQFIPLLKMLRKVLEQEKETAFILEIAKLKEA